MSVQTQYIQDKWKGKLAVFLFDDVTGTMTTASLVSGTNFLDYGEIAGSGGVLDTSTEDFKNQNKEVVATSSEYVFSIEATPMQTSKEIIDWNSFTVRGGKYVAYLYTGRKAAKDQGYFSVVEITPMSNVSAPGGTTSMKFKATGIVRSTPVTFSTTQTTAMRNVINLSSYPYTNIAGVDTAVTIPAGQEFVVVEAY